MLWPAWRANKYSLSHCLVETGLRVCISFVRFDSKIIIRWPISKSGKSVSQPKKSRQSPNSRSRRQFPQGVLALVSKVRDTMVPPQPLLKQGCNSYLHRPSAFDTWLKARVLTKTFLLVYGQHNSTILLSHFLESSEKRTSVLVRQTDQSLAVVSAICCITSA